MESSNMQSHFAQRDVHTSYPDDDRIPAPPATQEPSSSDFPPRFSPFSTSTARSEFMSQSPPPARPEFMSRSPPPARPEFMSRSPPPARSEFMSRSPPPARPEFMSRSPPPARPEFMSQSPPPVSPLPPLLPPVIREDGPSQAHQNLDFFSAQNPPSSYTGPSLSSSLASFLHLDTPISQESPYDLQCPDVQTGTQPSLGPPRPTTSHSPEYTNHGDISTHRLVHQSSRPSAIPSGPPTTRIDHGLEASASERILVNPPEVVPLQRAKPLPSPPKAFSSPRTFFPPRDPKFTYSPLDIKLSQPTSSSSYLSSPPLPQKVSTIASSTLEDSSALISSHGFPIAPKHIPDVYPSMPSLHMASNSRHLANHGVPVPSSLSNKQSSSYPPSIPLSDLPSSETPVSGTSKGHNYDNDSRLAKVSEEFHGSPGKVPAFRSSPLERVGSFAEASTSAVMSAEEFQLPPYISSSNKTSQNMNDFGLDSKSPVVTRSNAFFQELVDARLARRLQEEELERLAREFEEQERFAEIVRRIQEEESRELEMQQERHRLGGKAARQYASEGEVRELECDVQEQKDAGIARMMAEKQVSVHQGRGELRPLKEERQNYEGKAKESIARKHTLNEEAQRVMWGAYKQKEAEIARGIAGANARLQVQKSLPITTRSDASSSGTDSIAEGPPPYADIFKSPSSHAPPVPQTTRHRQPRQPDSTPISQGISRARAASATATMATPRPNPEVNVSRSSTVTGASVQHPNIDPQQAEPSQDRFCLSPVPSFSSSTQRDSVVSVVSDQDQNDEDVMKGVSYGFKPPDVPFFTPKTDVAPPPPPPFPEVIALSLAPASPFHIMASSWNHLVRLLKQHESRVEATPTSLVGSNTEHHLQMVIQFLKSPFTTAWRTVLYLSLDEPVPPNMPGASRFTNGDTSVLPYSYTKSIKRGAQHITTVNVNSELYVFPRSATSPSSSILPITFSNVAQYLELAMRNSRSWRVQSDPSNSMRRLARIVVACYPSEATLEAGQEKRGPSQRVGSLIRRVVRRDIERRKSHDNEDVYDIITPFRVEKYAPP